MSSEWRECIRRWSHRRFVVYTVTIHVNDITDQFEFMLIKNNCFLPYAHEALGSVNTLIDS